MVPAPTIGSLFLQVIGNVLHLRELTMAAERGAIRELPVFLMNHMPKAYAADDAPVKGAVTQPIARKGSEHGAPGASAEFVILFASSGVAAKTRIRAAPQRPHEG